MIHMASIVRLHTQALCHSNIVFSSLQYHGEIQFGEPFDFAEIPYSESVILIAWDIDLFVLNLTNSCVTHILCRNSLF